MSSESSDGRLKQLAADRRGVVPFALIAVFLLIISISLVASLDMREDPEPDIDKDLVFDRAEATAQTALREAVKEATIQAGEAPVTNPSDNKIGDALDTANEGDVFKNYVRLLIYIHAHDRLKASTQTVRGAEASAILPELTEDNAEERLEHVSLEAGINSSNLEYGKLRVEIEDVKLEVKEDGEVIGTREKTFEMTEATTLFELHEQTKEYEEKLNMGFFDGVGEGGIINGFGQHMAARLYLLAYSKSALKYSNVPLGFNKILPHDQNELMANHAKYSVQREVFGTTDPASEQEMTAAVLCLAAGAGADKLEEEIVDTSEDWTTNAVNSRLEDSLKEQFDKDQGDLAEELATEVGNAVGDKSSSEINNQLDNLNIEEILCDSIRSAVVEDESIDVSVSMWDVLGSYKQDEELTSPTVEASLAPAAAISYVDIAEGDISKEHHKEERKKRVPTINDKNVSEKVDATFSESENTYNLNPGKGREIEKIMDDVYSVEVEGDIKNAGAETEGRNIEPFPPDTISKSETITPETETTVSVENILDVKNNRTYPNQADQTFYDINIEIDQTREIEREWVECTERNETTGECEEQEPGSDSDVYHRKGEAEFIISGTYSPNGEVASEYKLEHAYVSDGGDGPGKTPDNFAGIPEKAVDDRVGVVKDASSADAIKADIENVFEEELDDKEEVVDDEEDVYDPADKIDEIIDFNEGDKEIDLKDTMSDEKWEDMREWLKYELHRMIFGEETIESDYEKEINNGSYREPSLLNQDEASDAPRVEPIKVNTTKYLSDPDNHNPFNRLHNNLNDKREDIVFQDTREVGENKYEYRNVADLARAELYHEFEKTTHNRIDDVAKEQKNKLDTLSNKEKSGGLLKGVLASVKQRLLGEALSFKDKVLQADQDELAPQDSELEGSPLLNQVNFEIHGSPTYLQMGNITRSDTPAVRPKDKGRLPTDSKLLTEPVENSYENTRLASNDFDTNHSSMYGASLNLPPYPGIPLLPPPGWWLVSLSIWNIEVGGEYARFEVSADTGDPASSTTYVREVKPVELEISGTDHKVGYVEPINYTSRTIVGVVMPGGQPGVGDGSTDMTHWVPSKLPSTMADCTENYPKTGPSYEKVDLFGDIIEADNPIEEALEPVDNINNAIPVADPLPGSDADLQGEKDVECMTIQFGNFFGVDFEDEDE